MGYLGPLGEVPVVPGVSSRFRRISSNRHHVNAQPLFPPDVPPELFALVVGGVHENVTAADPLAPQCPQTPLDHCPAQTLAAVFRDDRGVVQIPPPGVVPGQASTDQLAVL